MRDQFFKVLLSLSLAGTLVFPASAAYAENPEISIEEAAETAIRQEDTAEEYSDAAASSESFEIIEIDDISVISDNTENTESAESAEVSDTSDTSEEPESPGQTVQISEENVCEPIMVAEPAEKAAVGIRIETIDGKRYAVYADGTHFTGWYRFKSGRKAYCDPKNDGAFATGIRKIGKKGYYFTSKGLLSKGRAFIKKQDGKRYYVKKNGMLHTGWKNVKNGRMYFSKSSFAAKTGVKRISGKYYLFNSKGILQNKSGTVLYKNHKYWIRENGTLGKGWLTLGSWKLYFSKKTFKGFTGRKKIGSKYYVFNDDGILISIGNSQKIGLDPSWQYADSSAIRSGEAVLYYAKSRRKNITVAVNAGHGTRGGSYVKTWCHPDRTAKVTGGSTAAGAYMATAVSTGMDFFDGTPEAAVTLQLARKLKKQLLNAGYDVLMLRTGNDVQLDNVARTVIANNKADCHISLHWDGDGLSYDKGAYYMAVPDALKYMSPVAENWTRHEALGEALIGGLRTAGRPVWSSGSIDMDLTQTSYSTIPSVDIELGNAASVHDDAALSAQAVGLLYGINTFFGF